MTPQAFVHKWSAGSPAHQLNERYWLFQWSRPLMRRAVARLARFIATAEVSKFRCFLWLPAAAVADKNLVVFARADDTTLGLLNSRFQELWSLRLGTSLEDRPRHTPTTCFETFPFPAGLTPADTAHQRTSAPKRWTAARRSRPTCRPKRAHTPKPSPAPRTG